MNTVAQLTREDLDRELLRHYYNLPVSNEDHPKDVKAVGRHLGNLCRNNGLFPDMQVVDSFALGHDTDKPKQLDRRLFSYTEERSAVITLDHERSLHRRKDVAPELCLPYRKILWVHNEILDSHYSRPVRTLEGMIGQRADVDNTGHNYESRMAPVSFGLFVEKRYLAPADPEPLPFDVWHDEATVILGGFRDKKLSLGDFDVNETGQLWRSAQAANYERFCEETEERLREIVGPDICGALEDRYPPGEGWKIFSEPSSLS